MVTYINSHRIYGQIKQTMLSGLKLIAAILFTVLTCTNVYAQKPDVKALTKLRAHSEETIGIIGSGFGTDATKVAVTFGGVRGQINTITDTRIDVLVPPGATFDEITVTNLTNGLADYSGKQFVIGFNGNLPFDPAKLATQQAFDAEKGLYDVCLCDFDNDGKPDAASANKTSTNLTILRNITAAPGATPAFTKIPVNIGTATLHLKCADLNGDGKQDLVVIDDVATKVFFLRNTSTGAGNIQFVSTSITLTNHQNNSLPEIADLDLDGKPEVIITDQKTYSVGQGRFSILKNSSTTAAISFEAPLQFNIPGVSTDDIVAADLNGDKLPELITSQYQIPSSNLYIFENTSVPGTIALAAPTTLSIDQSVKRIKVGDLDGDDKPDIAVTRQLNGTLSIFRNTGTGNSIAFSTPTHINSDLAPWGLDFGDLNGDGKTDIAIASLTTNKITILNNTSSIGSLTFTSSSVTTADKNRHIKLGDMDGDGKPDIVFTDDGQSATPKISVLRNMHCIFPRLTPGQTPLSLCNSRLPYTLRATMSRGSYYQWYKDGNPVSCGLNQNTIDITSATDAGLYTVRVLQEGSNCGASGNCALESDGVNITIDAGTAGADPMAASNSPVCIGNSLTLTAADVGATQYNWRGPNGFSASGLTPTIPNFQVNNIGHYELDIIKGTCIARTEKIYVDAIDIPVFQINYSNSGVLCTGDPDKVLSIVPAPGSFNYKWFKDGNEINTGASLNVSAVLSSSGTYVGKASSVGCTTTVETAPVEIYVASKPEALFSLSEIPPICANQLITFNNLSQSDNNITAFYKWNFGDGRTSAETSPSITYPTDGTFNFTLEVSYENGACANSSGGSILVNPAPAISVINADNSNNYEFCEGQTLALKVNSAFVDYLWSTGETTPTITVSTAGSYSVKVTYNTCPLTAFRTVTTLDAPAILVSATPEQVNEGGTVQLSASGVNNYAWEPAALVDSPASATTTAGPLVSNTTFTVTGSDGTCPGTGTILVKVIGEAIVNKLNPSVFFSPDNQGAPESEFWLVENITDYPQCGIAIYDDKGVKVHEAKPYLNDWSGTFNGKKLPDGVYFYVIRCDGEEATPKTGSITILSK